MSSIAPGPERPSGAPSEIVCPALDPERRWDEPDALRGEIQLADQLVAHAAELARAHGEPSPSVAFGRLWQRFLAVRRQIREAYAVLTARLEAGQDPSPAEEWLLENSHVVEDQIREIKEDLPRGYRLELPRLATGVMRGHPRVYALCLDYLRHTDARLDLGTLVEYIEAYQRVSPLTIGELWAVPIMLRLGLLLTVGTLAAQEAGAGNREHADAWAEKVLAARHDTLELASALAALGREQKKLTAPFLVQFARRLRESDDPSLAVAFDWLTVQSQKLGSSIEELTRGQHLKQAADQVSVGNAITSMRGVAALEWSSFFERTSGVEAVLRRDPFGTYAATDAATRDRYRHVVETLAKRSRLSEIEVARATLALAEQSHTRAPSDVKRAHVGYYLVDEGKPELERQVGYRPSAVQRLRRLVLAHPSLFYFGTMAALTAAVVALMLVGVTWARAGTPEPWLLVAAGLLSLLPASEVALALTQALVTAGLKPRLLPRLDFDKGVPPHCRTLVVVPCLLDSPQTLAGLLEDLEVRSLANAEKNLHFALLTDFTDAPDATAPSDEALLKAAIDGIAELNRRYTDGDQRYWLLHRHRLANASEGRFMGWERKRGKLEELNRLLRGAKNTSFSTVKAPVELFPAIRYVITLDADTELPRETARRMVATLAHPLNAAEFDTARQRVVRGYGIVQPRVGALPLSSRKSRYASLTSGPSGLDPYTTAVSDVYQDLFAEGSYTGKAIYDVDAFAAALADRAPENLLLSHDLFESFFARSALATDIELLDEQPASYEVHASRQHRWMRGDWQIVGWLFPRVPSRTGPRKNDLRLLDRWKLADNLRRSVLPPALVLALAAGWSQGQKLALTATALFFAMLAAPLVAQTVLAVTREASRVSGPRFAGFGGALADGLKRAVLEALFLFDQALLSLDAISIAFYRLVSGRRRLEWVTMRASAAGARDRLSRRMLVGSVLAAAGAVAVAVERRDVLGYALPLLLLWCSAPFVSLWLSEPLVEPVPRDLLSSDDQRLLRLVARKTWRFFDHFVTAADHYLPPDNYQMDPRGVLARRTSPTNIGLYLLSVLAAHDFGVLTVPEVIRRLELTLDTLDKLPQRDGHLLNWYDTETLAPLPPEYVSTVDSGNLAAYLWTLASAGAELRSTRLATETPFLAVADALELAAQAADAQKDAAFTERVRRLEASLRASAARPSGVLDALDAFEAMHRDVAELFRAAEGQPLERRYWLGEAERTAKTWHEQLTSLTPFASLLRARVEATPGYPHELWTKLGAKLRAPATLEELHAALGHAVDLVEASAEGDPTTAEPDRPRAAVELRRVLLQAQDACAEILRGVERVAERCKKLADGMSFAFLLDGTRELFSIGYNVNNARLDTSYYDLLASEARLASLVAIAKGDAPQKHWFRLGRPRAKVNQGRSLLSWSGSMFEYLMPLLVTKSPPQTLLDETVQGAVRRQRAYGASRHVPWGVSESAYNVMDLQMTYQYRAFGVPGLGLKSGLAEDLVVAPYATALAALVDPVQAVKNLRVLAREGAEGQFGYFEAIDFSPTRLPPGKRGVVVRSFMAHHLGMTLVALDNVLHEGPMQRRFHADPRVKASELLLEERIPVTAPLLQVPEAALAAPVRHALDLSASEHVRLAEATPPRVHLLGHGMLSTLVTSTGTGALTWKGIDINRFREDPVFDAGGIYAYVRNLTEHKTWSSGYHPTRRHPDAYEASFFIDRVELRRRDGAVETITELVPSAEHPAEVRRFTLKNHGTEPLDLELTTFTELALAPRGADVAHRAFSSMFVETAFYEECGALVAHRRPRSHDEPGVWVAQVLTPEDEGFGPLDYDTSRAEFVGRGGSLERPHALSGFEGTLARRSGNVLDPAFVLRRRVHLDPDQSVRVALTTIMADSREELLRLVPIYAAAQAMPRAFELALADARVELRHIGVTAAQAHRFQRLLSAIVFPQPGLRAPLEPSSLGSAGRNALWARGISGDLPIVVVRLDHADFEQLLREVLLAHEYFRVNGVTLDLLVLNEEPGGYLQPLQEQALDVVRSTHSEGHLDQRGGIFLRRADQIPEGDRLLMLAAARAVFTASGGSLTRQLKRAARRAPLAELLRPSLRPAPRPSLPPAPRPELLFDNGFGGFRPDGREYVMVLERNLHTPAPWCNVIANSGFGCVVSETGSTFTWTGNSQRHRLTPWSNDALLDPSGEAVYVRDDEDGSVWTPTPAPSGGSSAYHVAHGQGYTRFTHVRSELAHELTIFVSPQDPVRIQRLRIENRGAHPRRISLFGVVEWVLGSSRETSRLSVMSAWDDSVDALMAVNPLAPQEVGTAFLAATAKVVSHTANREEFFGLPGSRRWPSALRRTVLADEVGSGLDPCAALHTTHKLGPGETLDVSFVLGQAPGREEARALVRAYSDAAAIEQAFEAARTHWDNLLGAVSVKTPDPSLDLLMNRWLLYQALGCRIWARSGFYQSSGAFGFRDQLQDVLCLLHTLPEAAREHLLRAAARQFVEGDVQHWWHPEAGDGVRTHCSDDMLWLPYAVTEYLRVTGDKAVLDEQAPFLTERLLNPKEHDLYSTPQSTHETATLYEHCARALDCSLAVGAHGLPRMGAGDWNDGMNRVGVAGKGESVWLAWFLIKVLRDFAATAEARKDTARAERWREHAKRVTEAAEAHAWDGAWYRRAFFDDGTPVGSATSAECTIDAIAQSWAVISKAADRERATRAIVESERALLLEDAQVMQLLTPPFTGAGPDPGYIASYPAGVRENGGQYTHGVLFTLRALAELGDRERTERLLNALNPIRHALSPKDVERYKVEPYVVAADVYSAHDHMGRGGWTWYTGSAGWFYRVVLEDILGLRRAGNELRIAPCLPPAWSGFELQYRFGRTELHIVVENGQGGGGNVPGVLVDGQPQRDASIRLVDDGRTHEVRVKLGERRLRSTA